jgi:predicted flap endonuclease-1-like 5' DNA nuclease
VAQVVECLLGKHEALTSNPSTPKKKKKRALAAAAVTSAKVFPQTLVQISVQKDGLWRTKGVGPVLGK